VPLGAGALIAAMSTDLQSPRRCRVLAKVVELASAAAPGDKPGR
jgi:hypothetical protein